MKTKTTGRNPGSAENKNRRTHNVSIRITEDLYEAAALAAQRDARSMANWIEILIVKALGASTPPRRGVRITNRAERGARIKEGLKALKNGAVMEDAIGE